MKKILLTTVHHPDVSLKDLKYICEQLRTIFDEAYLTISNITSAQIQKSFSGDFFHCLIIPPNGAADARRKVLKFALENVSRRDNYFYCDFDKVIVALLNRNSEFKVFISTLKLKKEYRIIGRNNKDFESYPDTWIETERITNKAAATIFKIDNIDLLAGCCAFNSKVGKVIAENSTEILTDTEWPLICKNSQITVNYDEVSFLPFNFQYNKGRNDYDWLGYIPRLKLALQAFESFKKSLEENNKIIVNSQKDK